MINIRMRAVLAALLSALLAFALVVVGGTAARAGGTCTSGGAAGKPAAHDGGKVSLWNVKNRGYTGTPFSFQMIVKRGSLLDGFTYQTYTYDNRGRGYRHSMTTGAVRPGQVVKVRTWCGGRRGADWNGGVYLK